MAKRSPFKNPKTLEIMFEERRNGASLLWLAAKYHRDHTTIMWHCRNHNVFPIIPLQGGRRKILVKVDKYAGVPEEELDALEQALLPMDDGPVCKGKSYFEYLSDAMKQSDFKHYFDSYGVSPFDTRYNIVLRK